MSDRPIRLLREESLSQAALERLAQGIAPVLGRGDVLALQGPLGSGKTTFARALIRDWLGNPDEEVPSPSFLLVQPYAHAGRDEELCHVDLYRISSADEAGELGLDEAAEAGPLVIEWPERAAGAYPPPTLTVRLALADKEGCRAVDIHASPHAAERFGRAIGVAG